MLVKLEAATGIPAALYVKTGESVGDVAAA
jgi:hypothetical protein